MKINENRYKNALLGLAAGDAWGYQVEFKSYDAMPHPVPQPTDEWVISDDTQMTLALEKAVTALEELGWLNENNVTGIEEVIIKEFADWAFGPMNNRAPGTTCMWSIRNLVDDNAHWADANGARHSAGCGSVMRLLPTIALEDGVWQPMTVLQGVITHNDPAAVASTLLLGEVARAMANGAEDSPLVIALDVVDKMCSMNYKVHPAVSHWALKHVADDTDEYIRTGAFGGLSQALDRAAERAVQADYSDDICRDVGEGWDAMTAVALAIMAANAYDIGDLTAKQAMEWAVTSNGDSDSIAAITGMLIGLTSADVHFWMKNGVMPNWENEYLKELP
ncbi:ADP-ribosylglycohydrolase [Gordonia phage Sixama]|uniref:ADP-ribosylglycohydrolase n=1 Tax=Gordonia phage Sixama TaxID=2653271 RepID=A0A5Q2F708_9CAUD|nr:ADP-ribosylglycohydrolase [Gordonia phage Sixama]QGF20235.1 ADP-ribosylglycohydrolase [Gordonia phage Sixama]